MRRVIYILMIVLLPLRGWMGEAMATTMAADTVNINLIAIKAINTPATADNSLKNSMSDCDMHKTGMQNDSNEKPSCNACQACNATSSLTSTAQITSIIKSLCAQPLPLACQFSSANLALFQKPPIL